MGDHILKEASRRPLGGGVVVVPYLLTHSLRILTWVTCVVDSGHIKAQHRFLFWLDSGLWKKEVLLSHLAQVERQSFLLSFFLSSLSNSLESLIASEESSQSLPPERR